MKALLIYPHQLFENHPGLEQRPDQLILSEDPLFFGDERYPLVFHAQKLMLHRASMRSYAEYLKRGSYPIKYFDYVSGSSETRRVVADLAAAGIREIVVCDVVDYILNKRLCKAAARHKISLRWLQSPAFINTAEQNRQYRAGRKRWFMADFYKWQRQRLEVLLDADGQPVGGQWSFDEDNRKKVPKKMLSGLPELKFPPPGRHSEEAGQYIATHFTADSGGDEKLLYPVNHTQAQKWLSEFLQQRFELFGPYEDAIVEGQTWLYHSVLTPMLNIGLLTPRQVLDQALHYAAKNDIPISSVEGFVRQVIGWREFMRATYQDLGVAMRNGNHWQHENSMPDSFYTATTGILPVDDTISRILKTGYCHHIERLMVLGGFMFLCEINPHAIYRWFMEMFIDSYDWVMVTNVYAMSQHADGGLITTKPYFSGSNYIRKMSHYPKAPWCDVWDALYWRWILKHADSLRKNPRWAMMVRTATKMDDDRKRQHLDLAESFLGELHG